MRFWDKVKADKQARDKARGRDVTAAQEKAKMETYRKIADYYHKHGIIDIEGLHKYGYVATPKKIDANVTVQFTSDEFKRLCSDTERAGFIKVTDYIRYKLGFGSTDGT